MGGRFFFCSVYMYTTQCYSIIRDAQIAFAPTVRHVRNGHVRWNVIYFVMWSVSLFVWPEEDPFRIETLSIKPWIGSFNSVRAFLFYTSLYYPSTNVFKDVRMTTNVSINWIYHKCTHKCTHLKDDQWKQDAPELNFESHSKGYEYLLK